MAPTPTPRGDGNDPAQDRCRRQGRLAPTRVIALAGWLGVIAAMGTPHQAQAQSSEPRRVAIVVGANEAAPGRRPLRYAHHDARAVERVLRRVGRFQADDIHVLLDPSPSTVLSLLDSELGTLRASGDETLLLFYYSGHADEQALYPSGRSLSFRALRSRLESDGAGVRVGIIDACRGGGWTGTRGLTETESFDVNVPLELSNEGSVLISSSSGLEDAHESEELEGGFFTHHWNAALRGAGDEDGDRIVTLTEAFEYAKSRTIRDTALHTSTPQHPSFRMNLQGRQELSLAHLANRVTTLTVEQTVGPLQLFHLGTGRVVLELPAGERTSALSILPGRYLLRTVGSGSVKAQEIQLRRNRPQRVRESELDAVDEVYLAARGIGGPVRPINLSTLPAGTTLFQGVVGIARTGTPLRFATSFPDNPTAFAGRILFAHGITDHIQLMLPFPALVFRASFGRLDLLPWAGAHESRSPVDGFNVAPGFGLYGEHLLDSGFGGRGRESAPQLFALSGGMGAGLDARLRIASNNSLIGGFTLRTPFLFLTGSPFGSRQTTLDGFDQLMVSVMLGGSVTIDRVVTISLAAQGISSSAQQSPGRSFALVRCKDSACARCRRSGSTWTTSYRSMPTFPSTTTSRTSRSKKPTCLGRVTSGERESSNSYLEEDVGPGTALFGCSPFQAIPPPVAVHQTVWMPSKS